jgi:hypothetical protein
LTHDAERVTVPTNQADPQNSRPRALTNTARNSRPWWRRPWIIPLFAAAAGFLIYQLPPWISLDPSRSRIPLHFPAHYWLIVGHVLFGTVALVTMCLQMWPWLRKRHPAVHRWSGRVYVFGGALPSASLALIMFPVAMRPGAMGTLMAASLWSITATMGYLRARQGRWREHRRYMLYSFAIMWGAVIWGFCIGTGWFLLSPWATTVDPSYVIEAARWIGWVTNLIVMQWWLDRTRKRSVEGPARATSRIPIARAVAPGVRPISSAG